MAGKGGGGAWKVAYADFVTAMMAFFMVMWLTSQDQKVKEAIAHYFVEPVGIQTDGVSTRPGKSGSLFDEEFSGQVPGASKRLTGRSMGTLPTPEMEESETMVVAEWLMQDPQMSEYWQDQARAHLDRARRSLPVRTPASEIQAAAAADLARTMRREVTTDALAKSSGLSQDLLSASLTKVEWKLIAEECLVSCSQDH